MANHYEIAVVYDPGLEVDMEKATARVEKILTDNGAEVTKTDNWGKRKLAYPIKKHESGIYVFYLVDIPAESVNKIEKTLNITDEVIRFLITRPDPKKAAKADAMRTKQASRRSSGDSEEAEADTDDEK